MNAPQLSSPETGNLTSPITPIPTMPLRTQTKLEPESSLVIQQLVNLKWITPEWILKLPKAMSYFESILLPLLKTTNFFPEGRHIFRAFRECSYEDTKVVLIGMDPYHDGSATGLCFDNILKQRRVSPSLRNLQKELDEDLSNYYLKLLPIAIGESNSFLGHLPQQGVLMLNTALTVEEHKAGSHAAIWKPFMDEVFQCLNQKDNIVWIMLGNHAKSYKSIITNPTHRFVEAVHPSPLSASRGFFGSKIFSRTNEALEEMGMSKINW